MVDTPITILLVEDNEADVKITLRAFAQAKPTCKVHVVRDGQEALDFIYHQGDYHNKQDVPCPDLILLDIRMPKVDGFQVLEKLKADPEHNTIPVIVLSCSELEEDKDKSYKSGASSYIRKPIHYDDFVKVVEAFDFSRYLADRLPSPKEKDPD
jgi:two-component system response regulator